MPLTLFWLLLFNQHQGFTEEITKKDTSESSSDLASTSFRACQADQSKFIDIDQTTQRTPFERFFSDSTHQSRSDGDFRSMEVHVLQKDFESHGQWMQPVFDSLARLSGHHICAAIQTAEILIPATPIQLGLGLLTRWKPYSQNTEREEDRMATAQVASSGTRQRERQRKEEGPMAGSVTSCSERQNEGGGSGQGQGSDVKFARNHHDPAGTAMDSQFNWSCSSSTSYRASAQDCRRSNFERAAYSFEKVSHRTGSRGESHCSENIPARRPGCSTDIVLSSGRSHNCPRSIGLCTTGTSQPAHSLEEFLSRCSGQVAKTHDRFPEGGKGTYKLDRGCSTGTTQCRHQVRRVQTRAWRPSCRCRCRSYKCRRIRRCRKGHDRCCSSGEPIHNVSTTDLITSISRGHGDRRSELQQEAKNRWRPRWAIFLCRSWVASWIAVAQCPIDATISTREAAFCSARQVVTEKYACLGQNKHPLLLKWGHSACQESWFVPEWEAHEAAFELSWKLGSSRSSCPTDVKLLKPTCGRDRHVQFSNDVDLCICSSTAPMRMSFKTTDAFIKQWPEKPWSLKSQCRKSSGTSLEPQSNRAVLIRKNHQELPFTQIRTTDEFHNVPSSWFPAATDPEMQEAEEEDETQFF